MWEEADASTRSFNLENTLVSEDLNEGLPDETIGGPFFVYWDY